MSDMPDVIYAWMGFNDNGSWDNKPCPCCESTKYLRADPVIVLLKQARSAMDGARFHKTNEHVFAELNKIIALIDKALEETE